MEYVRKKGLVAIVGVAFIAAAVGLLDVALPAPSVQPQVASTASTSSVPVRIGFIGDSITDGPEDDAKSAVEVEIAELGNNYSAVNHGKDGSTTADWQPGGKLYEEALAEFKRRHVRTVSIMLGTNDARVSNATPPDTYKKNMVNIINGLLASKTITRVVVNHPPYVVPGSIGHESVQSQKLLQSYVTKVDTLKHVKGVSIGDVKAYNYFKRHQKLLADGVHPTSEGYAELGRLWAQAFSKVLATTQQ